MAEDSGVSEGEQKFRKLADAVVNIGVCSFNVVYSLALLLESLLHLNTITLVPLIMSLISVLYKKCNKAPVYDVPALSENTSTANEECLVKENPDSSLCNSTDNNQIGEDGENVDS